MRTIVRLLVTAIAIFLGAYFLSGVWVSGIWMALLVAVVLGILNLFVKPILVVLTIPITIITLGLFLWVINALMLLLTDALIEDFQIKGFGWALLLSLIVSVVVSIFDYAESKAK